MNRYYIYDEAAPSGFAEISEIEKNALFGDEETKGYSDKVYRGIMSIDEVPDEFRETVQDVVNAKVSRWGEYKTEATEADYLAALAELGVKV